MSALTCPMGQRMPSKCANLRVFPHRFITVELPGDGFLGNVFINMAAHI